jgi:hypothetical protein
MICRTQREKWHTTCNALKKKKILKNDVESDQNAGSAVIKFINLSNTEV